MRTRVSGIVSAGIFLCACNLSETVLSGDARSEPRADEPYEDVGECTGPMPDGCLAFSTQIWPVATDGGATCTDSGGNAVPSTGPASAEWFDYIDCGDIKQYEARPCQWVRIRAYGDSCPGCVLWNIDYVLEENRGGDWIPVETVDPEPDVPGMEDDRCFRTESGDFRIRAGNGFYVEVFEGPAP
jgi:hypothetical protein